MPPFKSLHEVASELQKKYGNIESDYVKAAGDFVEDHFEDALFEIVDPFQTDMPILVAEDRTNDSLIFHVNISDDETVDRATTRFTGERRSAWQLFYWLNSGTNIRKVKLPADFGNETHQNSLFTASVQYNRAGIQYTANPREWADGMQARNWIELIGEALPVMQELAFDKVIK